VTPNPVSSSSTSEQRADGRRGFRVDAGDAPLAVGGEQELVQESGLTGAFDAADNQYEITVLDQISECVALLRERRLFDRERELADTVGRQGVIKGESRCLVLLHVSQVRVDALNIRSCSAMAKRSVIPAM
jgi:hypothetical protein